MFVRAPHFFHQQRVTIKLIVLRTIFAVGIVLSANTQLLYGQPDSSNSKVATADDTMESIPSINQTMIAEAQQLESLFTTAVASQFLAAVEQLPHAPARTIFRHNETKAWISEPAYSALSSDEQAAYESTELAPDRYYSTKYGTPLAFARVVELLGQHGLDSLANKKILDFGYGTIGQLRLLAQNGADATGVDIDSLLTALYAEDVDLLDVKNADGPHGTIKLVEGFWPSTDEVVDAVGGGFDVIVSKNTLKRGYINPARTPTPEVQIDLGVTDLVFLDTVHASLNPQGLFVIYNICPKLKPAPAPYVPWADGRSPWTREQYEAHGFEVLAFDIDDNKTTHAMAHLLGWSKGDRAMNPEQDLDGYYTIVRKHLK